MEKYYLQHVFKDGQYSIVKIDTLLLNKIKKISPWLLNQTTSFSKEQLIKQQKESLRRELADLIIDSVDIQVSGNSDETITLYGRMILASELFYEVKKPLKEKIANLTGDVSFYKSTLSFRERDIKELQEKIKEKNTKIIIYQCLMVFNIFIFLILALTLAFI